MYQGSRFVAPYEVESGRFGGKEAQSESDDRLIDSLSAVAELIDPVPQWVQASARVAFAWYLPLEPHSVEPAERTETLARLALGPRPSWRYRQQAPRRAPRP
jgi:hypothetical protein